MKFNEICRDAFCTQFHPDTNALTVKPTVSVFSYQAYF